MTFRATANTCCAAVTVQSAIYNFTPVLFLTLRERFSLNYEQLGLLILVNSLTQMAVALTFSRLVDRRGFRGFLVLSHALVAVGFALFGLSGAFLQERGFAALLASTVVFAVGGGLGEILHSPVYNAIPGKQNPSSMAFLHSFYAWGQVVVVLITTVLLALLGPLWPLITILWVGLAAACAVLFGKVPLPEPVPDQKRSGVRALLGAPYFWVAMAVIFCGSMAELNMSQWASAYLEKVAALPKLVGDVAGMCLFGATMGITRLWYGLKGRNVSVRKAMLFGAALCTLCYLAAALSRSGAVALAACALTGVGAALLWPGTLSLASARFPLAGTSLFALLTAGGCVGGSLGPWLVGAIAERAPGWGFMAPVVQGVGAEQAGLRAGMLIGALICAGAVMGIVFLRRGRGGRSV